MRVVDACAGAGGKSLHLAALMRNQGTIISLDTEAWKLDELRRRAKRNGVQIIQTRPIESSKTIKRLHGTADRLLLDVPCSGLGTLRRNPDAKWKLTPEFLDNVRATQADILRSYSKILRPGGQLVYATCSILPSENEKQVERFLSENPNFRLLEERKLTPAEHGFDGFYMARIEMVNASPAED
jgi:16S rRNA (cytosine967-C5)-methyltransferase